MPQLVRSIAALNPTAKRLGTSAIVSLMLAGTAYAADSSVDPPASCTGLSEFFSTACPLSWYGITLYGTVDMGVGWESHGTPFNPDFVPGDEYLISKNSNRALWLRSPNAMSQSNIGIRGNEAIDSDWSVIFDLEAGFDPYSFHLANAPHATAENAGVPLTAQNSYADSSRAGQFYNSAGYIGLSSPVYGTLTVFRQTALTMDAVAAYDPMGGSYAFSPIGYQGYTCGIGDTEDCRFTTSAKYRVNLGPIRVAALWQFGGYDQNNASKGAYEIQIGGDVRDLGDGVLSVDAIYNYVRDAVSITLAGNPVVNGAPVAPYLPQTLTATLSDDTSVVLLGKYVTSTFTVYAGGEWIQYAPPSDPENEMTDIAGDFLCKGCATTNNTNISNTAYSQSAGFSDKLFEVVWTGLKYAVTPQIDLTGAYYHYNQASYFTTHCSTNAHAQCGGTSNAVSTVVDWRFADKFDTYAGLMYSEVNGGRANGFLHHGTVDPTAGIRFRF